jgi:hypothetical protein
VFALALTIALPDPFVTAFPLERVALAPEPGALKLTAAFGTGLLYWSVTFACSMAANFVPTVADCGVPPVAATVIADSLVFVSEKLAEPVTPDTVAVTL